MRRFCFLMLAALLSCALLACNDSGGKIGVLDMNRLLRDSAPGKAGIKYIEQQQLQLQERMEAIQAKLEKNPKDEGAQQELQVLFMQAQQQVQADGQAVVGALLDAIQKNVDAFRQRMGYMAIYRIEALDSFDPALDITDAMMAEVNKISIDYKAILGATPLENPNTASAPDTQSGKEETGEETKESSGEPTTPQKTE